ncbi:uncharacterized protein LOC135370136 [Ornithodoros turicata]|uniref:uncharacterized protein LOC135370136 n=1 Tax=Ornithodoros turicata TaxID=34597 RepID=UPI003138AFF9
MATSTSVKKNMQEEMSPKWKDIREKMHQAIDDRDHLQVQQCLHIVAHLRLWLHPSTGESAMYRAVQERAFYIYKLLLSYNCDFRNREERKCLERMNKTEKSELQRQQFFVTTYEDYYLRYLESRTRSTRDFLTSVNQMYQALDNIELIQPILKVVATACHLCIQFDFEKDDVQCMTGCSGTSTLGMTNWEKEKLFIAAKQAKTVDAHHVVLGTIAHELCHLALHLVYKNDGKPYHRLDVQTQGRYQKIIEAMRQRKKDEIIDLAFGYNKEEEEVIVRIPHILAHHGSHGHSIVQTQAPELYEFFERKIIPDMMTHIQTFRPGKDAEMIKEQNARLGKAYQTDELNLSFDVPLQPNRLKDVPFLILTAPSLPLLEVLVHDAIKSTGQPYLFFEASQWDESLTDVFLFNKCNFVLLTYNDQSAFKRYLNFLSELSSVVGTRVIILTDKKNKEEILNEVQRDGFFGIDKNNYEDEISEACFENVTEKNKKDLRNDSHIHFQGTDHKIPFSEVMSVEDFSKFSDLETFLKLCKSRYVEIGPDVSELAQGVNKYYVKRYFERERRTKARKSSIYNFLISIWDIPTPFEEREELDEVCRCCGENDEECLINTSDKVVAICAAPGMGKSALAAWLSTEIKKRDAKRWVLHVNLPQRIGLVSAKTDVTDLQQLAILCGVKEERPDIGWFQQSVVTGTPFETVIIFDAFDEIQKERRAYIVELINSLKQSKVSRIYLMSRTMLQPMIEDAVNTIPLKMTSFSRDDIVPFLENFWRANGLVHVSDDVLHSAAMETVNSYKEIGTALNNPLVIRMIAELEQGSIDRQNCELDLESEAGSITTSQDKRVSARKGNTSRRSRSTFDVYKLFADYKYKLYLREKLQQDPNSYLTAVQCQNETIEKEFYHKLSLLAVRAIFVDDLKHILTPEELQEGKLLLEDVTEGSLGHGLLDGVHDGIPTFIHMAFAEFFAAHFLYEKTKRENVFLSPTGYQRQHERDFQGVTVLFLLYEKYGYRQVRKFFDSFVASSCPVHSAIIDEDASALSCITEEDLCKRDEFGRTILHVAVLYPNPDILKILPISESLMTKDKFDMTPFMYLNTILAHALKLEIGSVIRSRIKLRMLDVFCARLSDAKVEWAKEIPTVYENVKNEKTMRKSVLYHAVDGNLCSLLRLLLSQLCRKWNERYHGIGSLLRVDVDSIRDDKKNTLLFYANSVAVLELLLPYSDVRTVNGRGQGVLHYHVEKFREKSYFPNWQGYLREYKFPFDVFEFIYLRSSVVDVPDHCGNTLLYSSLETGCKELVKLVLLRSRIDMCKMYRFDLILFRGELANSFTDIIDLLLPHSPTYQRPFHDAWSRNRLWPWAYDPLIVPLVSLYFSTKKLCRETNDKVVGGKLPVGYVDLLPYVETSDADDYVRMFRDSISLWDFRDISVSELKLLLLRFINSPSYLHTHGRRVLHRCIESGDKDAIKLLLPHSYIDATDYDVMSDCVRCCKYPQRRLEVTRLLWQWMTSEHIMQPEEIGLFH